MTNLLDQGYDNQTDNGGYTQTLFSFAWYTDIVLQTVLTFD